MTTAKDYLESALKAIDYALLNIDCKTLMARRYVTDVKMEILAAARVLGIELEKEGGK